MFSPTQCSILWGLLPDGLAAGHRGRNLALAARRRYRPEVLALEGRLTPSFGDLLHTFLSQGAAANDSFGQSVSLTDRVLVSHPNTNSAQVFDARSGYFLQGIPRVLIIDPTNGLSPSALSPLDRVLIGEPLKGPAGFTAAGDANLYDTWGNFLFHFADPNPANNDYFGAAVAASEHYVLVGAPGYSPAANVVAAGKACLFDAVTGATLRTFTAPIPGSWSLFGWSVAVSNKYVLVGAPGDSALGTNSGAAYLFDAQTGVLLHTYYKPTNAVAFDTFGWSVALWGNTIVVGAPGDNTGAQHAGSAYVFDAVSGGLLHTLNNPHPVAGDQLGGSVAVSVGDNSYVLVGAPFHPEWPQNPGSGAAYLFDAHSGALLNVFFDPPGVAGDHFGASVAVSDLYALVGAPGDSTSAPHAGAAYLFDVVPNPPPPQPGPPPAPPAQSAQGVIGVLHSVPWRHKRHWMVQVRSARTGRVLADFACPFQAPRYRGMRLLTLDANGDGLGDTILLFARRGKRLVTELYPFLY
jgi:hypothetical protein